MKQTVTLFQIGLKQIAKDGILLVLLPAPFLAGLLFKFAVPFANGILEEKFSFSILPWYGLIDGMLICLMPMIAAMIFAFLLLEERDEGVNAFYQITPAGGYYYLTARIGIPMAGVFIITILSVWIFHLTPLSFGVILTSSFVSALTGIALAMMVVSMADNRVEGLAISKLMGISFLGLIVIWFVPKPYSYFCSFLPSFWIGKLIMDGVNPFTLIIGISTCFIWILLFSRKFLNRIG